MKKIFMLLIAASMTIFSATSCDKSDDNGTENNGGGSNNENENGQSGETFNWDITPTFNENGNTMTLEYKDAVYFGNSMYSTLYTYKFTFSNGICSAAEASISIDPKYAKEVYNYIKAAEEAEAKEDPSYVPINISLNGNCITVDVTSDFKGLKQEYLRCFCKFQVEYCSYKFDRKEDFPNERAFIKDDGNQVTVFYGLNGYHYFAEGKITEVFNFEMMDWYGESSLMCVNATRVIEYPSAVIAEFFYRTEFLHEDELDYDEEDWFSREGKLDGNKIYEDITELYYETSKESILEDATYEVEQFNNYYFDDED